MNPDVKPVSNDDVPGLLLRAARLPACAEIVRMDLPGVLCFAGV